MAKNALKMQFEGQLSANIVFLDTRNPNVRSTLQPEVELMVFLRMRSNKITKKMRKIILKCSMKA